MADKTISNLPESLVVEDKQAFPVEDNVSTKKMTIGTLRESLMRQTFYGINFCNDTSEGDVNAIVITPSIPITSLKNGLRLFIMCKHTNTSNVKMKIFGISNSIVVVNISGQPLTPNAVLANSMREFVYFDGKFYLMVDTSLAKKDLSNVSRLSQDTINAIMPNSMDYGVDFYAPNDNFNVYEKFKSVLTIQAGKWASSSIKREIYIELYKPMRNDKYLVFATFRERSAHSRDKFGIANAPILNESVFSIEQAHPSTGCWLALGY